MKISIVLAGLVLIAGVAFAMNEVSQDKTYSWRYKMTVEVETPEGEKNGSAVRQLDVTLSSRPGYQPYPYHFSSIMRGEAIVIDLGERGLIFGLIGPDVYRNELFAAFPHGEPQNKENFNYYNSLEAGTKISLTDESGPWLVTFSDIKDPQSIKTVTRENISDIFGTGVRVAGISIEITEQPPEWGTIKKVLPWFGQKKIGLGGFADPNKLDPVNYLTSSSFQTGEPK